MSSALRSLVLIVIVYGCHADIDEYVGLLCKEQPKFFLVEAPRQWHAVTDISHVNGELCNAHVTYDGDLDTVSDVVFVCQKMAHGAKSWVYTGENSHFMWTEEAPCIETKAKFPVETAMTLLRQSTDTAKKLQNQGVREGYGVMCLVGKNTQV